MRGLVRVAQVQGGGRVISVLSDGLGSGIKASVLSTMTSSMLLNFSMMNEDITAAAAPSSKTLPRDEVRKISYSTFCLCDIDCFGNTRIAEYENPAYYLFRGGQFVDVEKKRIPVERDDMGQTAMWLSEFAMEKEDRIIFFSDGVSQSGMGNRNMPFGWEEGAKAFIRECVARNPSISAKELARKVVIESEKNDGYTLKDDTSCCVIYMRKPRNLLICTGPPFDEKNDAYLSKLVTEFPGRKIICGGTTANILSRETGREITLDMEMMDRTCRRPHVWRHRPHHGRHPHAQPGGEPALRRRRRGTAARRTGRPNIADARRQRQDNVSGRHAHQHRPPGPHPAGGAGNTTQRRERR